MGSFRQINEKDKIEGKFDREPQNSLKRHNSLDEDERIYLLWLLNWVEKCVYFFL